MLNSESKSYNEFFKEDLYGGFVSYLIDKYGVKKIIDALGDESLFSKKGVNYLFRREFNVFLAANPKVYKRFVNENGKCFSLRNIAGGDLAFPIDTSDDILMVKEKIRTPNSIPVNMDDYPRASWATKKSASFEDKYLVKSDDSKGYLQPRRLTVHFKKGFGTVYGKTTESFMVNSRSDAMDIILGRFKDKVAYARIMNEEEFVFVRPRNGKVKRNRKLRSKV